STAYSSRMAYRSVGVAGATDVFSDLLNASKVIRRQPHVLGVSSPVLQHDGIARTPPSLVGSIKMAPQKEVADILVDGQGKREAIPLGTSTRVAAYIASGVRQSSRLAERGSSNDALPCVCCVSARDRRTSGSRRTHMVCTTSLSPLPIVYWLLAVRRWTPW